MKSSFVAVALSLFAGAALASPADASAAMLDDRQMKAVHVLHNNKEALGLSREESEKFDKFMTSMRKRTPQLLGGGAGAGAGSDGSDLDGLTGEAPAATATGTAAAPSATPTDAPKGLLGGALLPGIL